MPITLIFRKTKNFQKTVRLSGFSPYYPDKQIVDCFAIVRQLSGWLADERKSVRQQVVIEYYIELPNDLLVLAYWADL